jgi:hypothetical protein
MEDEMLAFETLGYLQNPAHSVDYTPTEATWLTEMALVGERLGPDHPKAALDAEGLRLLVEFSAKQKVKLTKSNLQRQMERYVAAMNRKQQ